MKLRSSFAVLTLVCCIATSPVQAGCYAVGGAIIATGVSFLGAGGLLVALGNKFVHNIAPQYNKSELVVTGYDISSSGCSVCYPGGTSGTDGPCFWYTYNLQVLNAYIAYINSTQVTENVLSGSLCGNDPNRLRKDASEIFPIGYSSPIFYRIRAPKEWVYSLSDLDPYGKWSSLPFIAGVTVALAGIIVLAREKWRRTHGDYQTIPAQ